MIQRINNKRKCMKRILFLIVLLIIPLPSVTGQGEPLQVVATTTIIADAARNVGGDLVNVTALVPPESDVHAFEPRPQDALLVAEADVVLVNGAGLEAFLSGLIENAANVQPIVVSAGVEILAFGDHTHEDDHEHDTAEVIGVLGDASVCGDDHGQEADAADQHEHGSCDPHVWTDPHNVMIWAQNIADAFATADSENANTYQANAEAYITQLETVEGEVRDILAAIPDERRVLVTNHEFFGYFAHAFDFEVVGVVIAGGTTLTDPDPQALAALIETVTAEGVPAIFAEVSSTPGLAETVAQEAGIQVVTTIYSDSLSAADGPAATYMDYLQHNARTIADALKG
jgi:zinc/manganese transport system substrate-binding protein